MTPPFVALTGGMGAGKSTALAALARLGAATLSTDAVVHELYAEPDVVAAITGRWGDDVAPGGVVDRSAVAGRAFATPRERAWLEALIWPRVARRVAEFRAAAQAADPAPSAIVVETPMLFEAGIDGMYDATIAVTADDDLRAQRLGERGQAALAEREARQLPQADKARRATFAVDNSGTVAELEQALADLLDRLADP